MSERKKTPGLSSQAKEIVYNVSEYFENEIANPSNTPKTAFIIRTSEATSVSEATVTRIRREKGAKGHLDSPVTRKPYKNRTEIDDFDMCAIRNKIHEFYTVRRQLPTLKQLHQALKEDMNFPKSKSFLRKLVKQLGFRWKRCQSYRKVLIERFNIVDLRCEYLRRIEKYRQQGLNLVYLDETWIVTAYTAKYCWQSQDEAGVLEPVGSRGQRLIVVHAGGRKGFVEGALLIYKAASTTGDYHSEMNGETFKRWFQERLLDNLQEKSVIIMDNASYHSVHSDKNPTSSTRKADIQEWLRKHNIPFDNNMLRPQLLALAKKHKSPPNFVIDKVAKDRGHEILRLPPYHPDLNPIELVWSRLKKIVACRNTTFRVNDVLELTKQAFQEITPQDWENNCNHVLKVEAEYRQKDIIVDQEIDRIIINLSEDSDSSSSSESESNEDSS